MASGCENLSLLWMWMNSSSPSWWRILLNDLHSIGNRAGSNRHVILLLENLSVCSRNSRLMAACLPERSEMVIEAVCWRASWELRSFPDKYLIGVALKPKAMHALQVPGIFNWADTPADVSCVALSHEVLLHRARQEHWRIGYDLCASLKARSRLAWRGLFNWATTTVTTRLPLTCPYLLRGMRRLTSIPLTSEPKLACFNTDKLYWVSFLCSCIQLCSILQNHRTEKWSTLSLFGQTTEPSADIDKRDDIWASPPDCLISIADLILF